MKRQCISKGFLFSILLISSLLQVPYVDVQAEEEEVFQVQIVLQQYYLDGDVSEEVVEETVTDINQIVQKYADWNLIQIDSGQMIFKKYVDDISPLLKSNGFFGLTNDGTLSIFNGKPDMSNVIHSFFQIDVGKLESKKQQELKQGIPVRSKDQFIQVLEAFKPYSLTMEN